jgi:hypothetical protein
MIFTRYLYIKDEVEISLTTSILEKKEESVFWAYELYHSGYENETFTILWKIYYYFFSTLNPSFETYFLKKHKEWLSDKQDVYVSLIVQNLMIRPFNLDVFFLHKINTHLELEEDEVLSREDGVQQVEDLLRKEKYLEIATLIMKCDETIEENIFTHFAVDKTRRSTYRKIIQFLTGHVDPKIILISRMMTYYSSEKNKKGRSFYVIVEPEEVVVYETIIPDKDKYRAYKILPIACMYSIDKYNYLSLFTTERERYQSPMNVYHYFWLFHASKTPIWESRLKQYNGTPDTVTKRVQFKTDEEEELFYDNYGYEPDEQRIDTQYKNMQIVVPQRTWVDIYNTYKEFGLFVMEEEIVEAFDKIRLFE